ncbi:MAG: metal-dependent hydrolase [bacterium]
MPDLVTHSGVAYLIYRLLVKRGYLIIFLVGTILPDVITRIPFFLLESKFYWLFHPLHTPGGITLVCLWLSYFFEEDERKTIFISLWLGSILHLGMDLLQYGIISQHLLLFPFSLRRYEIGLFSSEASMYTIPLWVGLIVVVEWALRNPGRLRRIEHASHN